MTSLARQLQKLALPHAQSLLSEDKRRPSLLFDPKEAANLDRDTIFSIGSNGLEELQNIDEAFHGYEMSLFNETAQDFERSIQSQEVNVQLDETIGEFLVRLSPYFLLKPAHKALEWLIYRYRIHQFNVDELITCILPYHDSKIFVRVVQLLKLDDPTSRWHWIHPIQKPGVPLATSTLVTHCAKDPAFRHFVCEMVPKFLKVHGTTPSHYGSPLRVLMSFYASTIVGSLEYANEVNESVLSQLLPYLIRGVKSKNIDYKAATYMILGQLVNRVKLRSSFVETVVASLTKYITPQLVEEAIMCLLLVYQTQSIDKLPKRSLKHLCKVPAVVQVMVKVSSTYSLRPLLRPFVIPLVPAAVRDTSAMTTSSDGEAGLMRGPAQYHSVLEGLLHDVVLDPSLAEDVVRSVVKEYLSGREHASDGDAVAELNMHFKELVRVLERRYPAVFDKIMSETAQDMSTEVQRSCLNDFISLTLSAAKHEILPDSQTSLILGLNHPNVSVRCLAVEHLVKTIVEKQDYDASFAKGALCDRLRDDDEEVVLRVVQLKQTLLDIISPSEILEHLLSILERRTENVKSTWNKCKVLAIELMCSEQFLLQSSDLNDTVLLECLALLFVTSPMETVVAQAVLDSQMAARSPLLKDVIKPWKSKHASGKSGRVNFGQLNLVVVEGMARGLVRMKETERNKFVDLLVSHTRDNVRYQSLVLLTVASMLERVGVNEAWYTTASKVMEIVNDLIKENKVCSSDTSDRVLSSNIDDGLLMTCVQTIISTGSMSYHTVTSVMHALVDALKIDASLSDSDWWDHDTNACVTCLIKMFDLLTSGSVHDHKKVASKYRQLLENFLKDKFSSAICCLKFLSSLWTHHCSSASQGTAVLQARALAIAGYLISSEAFKFAKRDLDKLTSVTVRLLLSITSPVRAICESSLGLLQSLNDKCSVAGCLWRFQPIATKLLHCREELMADPGYMPQALAGMYRKSRRHVDDGQRQANTKKKLKKQQKHAAMLEAFDGLLDVAVDKSTPVFITASLLRQLGLVNSVPVLETLMPLLGRLLELTTGSNVLTIDQQTVVECIVHKFAAETAAIFVSTSEAFRLFIKSLKISSQLGWLTGSLQLTTLSQITREFFQALPSDNLRQDLLHILFDVWVDAGDTRVAEAVRRALKGLSLDAGQVLVEVQRMDQKDKGATVRDVKRIRRSSRDVQPTEGVAESREWRRLVLILEVLQTKKKLKRGHLLVPALFSLISRCLEVNDQSSVEYTKQLCLSCIQVICQKLSPDNTSIDKNLLSERQFTIDVIVQCIRVSDNPQTHRQALLLLSQAAAMFPEHVLHNVMSIFTFMGANVMRQDDAYSFQVISRTVETVIPALVLASERDSTNISSQKLESIVSMVIRVFVDAHPHIPHHRRLPLFSKLITTVGSERFLWVTLVLLIEVFVTKGLHTEHDGKEATHPHLEFCLSLCHQFEPGVQVKSVLRLLEYLASLPQDISEPKPAMGKRVQSPPEGLTLFDPATHTAKQLRHFKFTTTSFITSVLSSTTFIGQVVELSEEETGRMQPLYQNILEKCLQYVTTVAHTVEQHSQDVSAKFWRALLHKAYDVLDKINSLLPSIVFVTVVTGLMQSELANVRRKAMELLNNKLHQHREPYSQEETVLLLGLVDSLVTVARADGSHGDAEELAVNRQTALYSLKLLCKAVSGGHADTFKKVIPVSVDTFLAGPPPVSASALLCLAELCLCLKAHAIPYLSRFMPPLLTLMSDGDVLVGNELLWVSGVTTLQKVLESLPHFLSPYTKDIVHVSAYLSSLVENANPSSKTSLTVRLKTVRSHLSEFIPARVLLPAIVDCYHQIEDKKIDCIPSLLSILSDHISHMTKTDLGGHHSDLVNFFLTVLDFRQSHSQVNRAKVSEVEGHILNCILTLVLRLSEASFRPMFLKLYDWAGRDGVGGSCQRLLPFYRLMALISEQLKELFTLFAGQLVKQAANLLDALNSSKRVRDNDESGDDESMESDSDGNDSSSEETCSLLQYILTTLYNCFLHDNDGFMNKERFDTLMQPLVDQIENRHGGDVAYQDRMTQHVVPCLAQFAVAVGDGSLWRPLNYQVCLKTRHASAKVRFVSLNVIEAFSSKLGEDFMTLLPETIPFLAELMEDESVEVEQRCQQVIGELEKVLGEPLQKYF